METEEVLQRDTKRTGGGGGGRGTKYTLSGHSQVTVQDTELLRLPNTTKI